MDIFVANHLCRQVHLGLLPNAGGLLRVYVLFLGVIRLSQIVDERFLETFRGEWLLHMGVSSVFLLFGSCGSCRLALKIQ